MGLFDIFDKKSCSICGGEIGLLGNRKLEDGNMCKECAKKLSPLFSERRHSTVAEINEQLAYREQNEKIFAAFNTTISYGGSQILRMDENKRQFTVAYSYDKITPDVISFDQVTGCTSRVDDNEVELKQTNAQGEQVSYVPRRYLHKYYFYIDITVNSPYFEKIHFQLNSQPVEISDLDRTNVNSGGLLGALLGSSQPMSLEDRQYQQYQEQCDEIIRILNSRDAGVSRSAAPATDAKTGTAGFYTQYKNGPLDMAMKVNCSFAYSYRIANQQVYDISCRSYGTQVDQEIVQKLASAAEMELTRYFEDGGISDEIMQNPPAAASAAVLVSASQPILGIFGVEITSFQITAMDSPDMQKVRSLLSGMGAAPAVSSVPTAPADDWLCEFCGTKNSSKFCSGCGSKRP